MYKIDVRGTGIIEWYLFGRHKTEEQVKEIWLDDVSDKMAGERLASLFRGNVEVTDLWKKRQERQDQEKTLERVVENRKVVDKREGGLGDG